MSAPRTIAFLDLTGFTALTDTHGDDTAANVADQFVAVTSGSLGGRGRLVKTLGDGVLLDFDDPAAAIDVADTISRRLHALDNMPELTGGVATGTVVERSDDVLGATVNLAARLAALAPSGQLWVTDPIARSASAAGWTVQPLGETEIRGFHDPVWVHRVLLCLPEHCVVDPVCGMRLTPSATTPYTTAPGRRVWVCSPTCLRRVETHPTRYRAT